MLLTGKVLAGFWWGKKSHVAYYYDATNHNQAPEFDEQ